MFCTFLLAQKGTQKRPPQSIYNPIAGRSFNQLQIFGRFNLINSTLRTESAIGFCNFNITDRCFNSTTRYTYINNPFIITLSTRFVPKAYGMYASEGMGLVNTRFAFFPIAILPAICSISIA